ncbi:MAG: hypothetical protein Q9181_001008 [Wetmoreana brouardii]
MDICTRRLAACVDCSWGPPYEVAIGDIGEGDIHTALVAPVLAGRGLPKLAATRFRCLGLKVLLFIGVGVPDLESQIICFIKKHPRAPFDDLLADFGRLESVSGDMMSSEAGNFALSTAYRAKPTPRLRPF